MKGADNRQRNERYKAKWVYVQEDLPAEAQLLPDPDESVLIAFSNYSGYVIGRCEKDEDGGVSFYEGDDDKTLESYGLVILAWTRLPDPPEACGWEEQECGS